MSDLINRQDVIEKAHLPTIEDAGYEVIRLDYVLSLPSAEPTIIRCRDCKHHDGIRCFRWNSTIITGFDDYCSNAERRGEQERGGK